MLEKITRRILGPVYYARYKDAPDAFKYYRTYSARDRISREALNGYQLSRLRQLLLHAREHTVYYRRLFSDCSFDPGRFESIEQLGRLPALTKNIVRENVSDMLADNIAPRDRHESITGGTSGVKMEFYRDNACLSHRTAIQWRSDAWAGWRPYANLSYIWPASQDFSSRQGIKQKIIKDYLTGVQAYNAGLLGDKECAEIARGLLAKPPLAIRCFPSPAVEVAEYLKAHKISVPGLQGIVTTGEPLYSHQRRILEEGFGAPVFNLYASREVGTTAAECSAHEDLHIASDSVLLEITDNGSQLEVGEHGEILITDLHNFGMPLIRYAIGDFGRIVERACSCGMPYPLLENVVGRIVDNFYDKHGRAIATASIVLHLIDEGPKIGQAQLIQTDFEEIVVRISTDPYPDDDIRAYYVNTLKRMVEGLERIKFELVEKIDNEKSGKYRFAICRIPAEEVQRRRSQSRSES